jgi:Tol biopolymer transport system component
VVGSIYNAEWSPDGKYLAYVSERRTTSASQNPFVLYIRSDQTGEEKEIPLPISGFRYVHWAADSGAVFATMLDKSNFELFKIDIRTGKLTLVVPSGPDSNITNFAVSPDGKALYYALLRPKTPMSIIRRDLESGQEKEIYQGRDGDALGLTTSPDGKFLSFGRMYEGIRIVPAAGGEPRDLLLGTPERNARFMRHAWTADGKTILFVKIAASGTKEERREVWQIPSAGGEAREINMGMEPRTAQLHLHSDGRRIVFTSGTRSSEVWVMENFLPAGEAAGTPAKAR